MTATTAADNSTVSSSGSSTELNENSSTEKTVSAPENSTDTAVEQHENVKKLADEAQAKEQARQSERATKLEQCAQFPANMKVVIKSAAGAKCRKDLLENGSEGKVAPTYDHTCEMNDGYVLVSYAYQGVDLKVNHFPACDLSVVSVEELSFSSVEEPEEETVLLSAAVVAVITSSGLVCSAGFCTPRKKCSFH